MLSKWARIASAASHTPPVGFSGYVFTALSGTWDLTNDNAGQLTTATAQAITVTNTGTTDHAVSCTIVNIGSNQSQVGVCARVADDNNYYVLIGNAMYKRVAGAFTQLGSSFTNTVNGDVLRLVVSGTTITGFRNGSSVVSVTDSALSTGTKAGIRSDTNTTARFGSFTLA